MDYGNAMWGGVRLRDVLEMAGPTPNARHVAFEGFDKPLGSSGISFIRSIPIEKAMDSTLLAYEMNGEALPLKHGFPLRSLALGWTGANCVKWLNRISVLREPHQGFFMDKVYRVFDKGQDPGTGAGVTGLNLKSFITQPLIGETFSTGKKRFCPDIPCRRQWRVFFVPDRKTRFNVKCLLENLLWGWNR
ncbi:MAG: molybdopterin-dependent oxidoreductase [Desulfobacterales bacterium]|nr:molybdopterin-dependent oxidoreductase [Desulfobacterales bacterium]